MDKGKLKALDLIKKMAMKSLLKKDDDEDEKDKPELEGMIIEVEGEVDAEPEDILEDKKVSKIRECPHCQKIIHDSDFEKDFEKDDDEDDED